MVSQGTGERVGNMTATADTLALVSPYTVGDTGSETLTTAQFNSLLAWAERDATRDSIPADYYDHAVSLLIAHYAYMKQADSDKQSESYGSSGNSWSKVSDMSKVSSPYMAQYDDLIQEAIVQTSYPSAGISRADTTMQGLSTDQNPIYGTREYR